LELAPDSEISTEFYLPANILELLCGNLSDNYGNPFTPSEIIVYDSAQFKQSAAFRTWHAHLTLITIKATW
jgi:hypothetical protein